jgi:hypothetical protein
MYSLFGTTFGTTFVRPIVCVLVLLLGVGMVRGCAPDPTDNPAYDALSRTLTRRIRADSLALDSARVALAVADKSVTHTVTRYHTLRDTLHLTDTLWVKAVVASADSVVRACTELQTSCQRFRVTAESTIADLRTEREALQAAVKASRPSKLDGFVRRALPVVGFVAGVWVGSKVTR